METVSFPGLGLNIPISRTAFTIGNWSIAWYGIIIAAGLLTALIYGLKRSKTFGITADDLADVVIFGIIAGVIGARLYYVLFYVDSTGSNPYFSNPLSMLYIWNGGLGIYGGVIAAFIAGFIACKIKKISVGAVFDIASLGFLIGQAIGRWGNFVNQEAYGSATNLPWRMIVSFENRPVHPCFLYESLWCILGFILLHIYSKHRKFNGELFLMYVSWYAFGRFFIEGLRTDSLMLGKIKVTQLVAVIFFIASISLIIYKRIKIKKAVIEAETDYNPLFEDTAKAVEEETAAIKKETDENEAAADASEGETEKGTLETEENSSDDDKPGNKAGEDK